MKSLWSDALDVVKNSGVETVTLRYVSANGGLVDAVAPIDALNESSLEDGIKLENGAVVYPNPNTAILNPFLEKPAISFVCELQRRSMDPVRLPTADGQVNSLQTPVPSIFPLTVAGRPVKEMSGAIPMQHDASKAAAAAFAAQQRQMMIPGPNSHGGSIIMSTLSGGSVAGSESHRGTSCHQCKNARPMTQLAFCSTLFNKRTSADMRNCRKKFCQGCLTKFYGDSIENSHKAGWICPSCRGICRCAACARKRRKNKEVIGAAFQQVAGAQIGAVLEQQMRTLSNLILPDCHDYVVSNPNMSREQTGNANANANEGGDIADGVLTTGGNQADQDEGGAEDAVKEEQDNDAEQQEEEEPEKDQSPAKESKRSRRSARSHPYENAPSKRSLRSK